MKLPWRRKALEASPGVVEALRDGTFSPMPRLGGTNSNSRINEAFQRGQAASYGWMYVRQPSVRTVVEYISRNVAQLPLKLFERVSDTERIRREDHPAAESVRHPSPYITSRQFMYALVADFLVYDNAYVLKFRSQQTDTITLVRICPAGMTVNGGRFWPDSYRVWRIDGTYIDVPPDDVLHWQGYNPEDSLLGVSKLETLRRELAGDLASQETVQELLESGLRGGYVKRPLEAPEWSPQAALRFQEQWTAALRASPRKTPVLDEGMEFDNSMITPKDAQLLDSRRFTVEEVARLYGVPTGVLSLSPSTERAEQRQEVYADVLPPITVPLAEQFCLDLLEAEYNLSDYYFEFDLNEKLRGDLESRFPAMTAAAGRPWLTVNEVRAKENMPPVEDGDGDALTIPTNVVLAGAQGQPTHPQLPAPNVMPPQNPNGPPADGSYREPSPAAASLDGRAHLKASPAAQVTDCLLRLYRRQESAVRSGKELSVERFSRELGDDLLTIAGTTSDEATIRARARRLNEVLADLLKSVDPYAVFARARESAPAMATLLAAALAPDPKAMKELELPAEVMWERAGFAKEDVDRMVAMRHAERLLDAAPEAVAGNH